MPCRAIVSVSFCAFNFTGNCGLKMGGGGRLGEHIMTSVYRKLKNRALIVNSLKSGLLTHLLQLNGIY